MWRAAYSTIWRKYRCYPCNINCKYINFIDSKCLIHIFIYHIYIFVKCANQIRWITRSLNLKSIHFLLINIIINIFCFHIWYRNIDQSKRKRAYGTRALKFNRITPLSVISIISFKKTDIDATCNFVEQSTKHYLLVHARRKYASYEFWRYHVPLWVLLRKWGLKGVCLRKRWGNF